MNDPLCSKKLSNLAQTLRYDSSKMSNLVETKFEQNRATFYYITMLISINMKRQRKKRKVLLKMYNSYSSYHERIFDEVTIF